MGIVKGSSVVYSEIEINKLFDRESMRIFDEPYQSGFLLGLSLVHRFFLSDLQIHKLLEKVILIPRFAITDRNNPGLS